MTRDVNINSTEWCDIIFEGKNKEYGAYEMRLSSSRRHLIAFGCVALMMATVTAIPKIMEVVKPATVPVTHIDDSFVLSSIPVELPEENLIVEARLTPPPPAFARSITFTPPVITPDQEVTDENEMASMETLNDFDGLIGTVTVENGTRNGVLAEPDTRIIVPPTTPEPIQESAEQMPVFPGGTSELMSYLQKNMRYPSVAVETGVEGRVIVKFVVNKTGSISDVHVIKGFDPSCDREAVRVVSSMPNWIPGKQNGNPVAVYFTLPVVFRLQR